MRIVLMILDHNTRVADHGVEGAVTIQALDGRVVVTLLGSSFDLTSGHLLSIERDVSHALVAIEDSAVLLTIAWRGRPAAFSR